MARAFIFPGQGSQAVGMGKALAEAFAAAREVFEEVDEALSQKLSRLMWEGPESDLILTENAQPAIMAASHAVIRVLQNAKAGLDFARHARLVAGHSLGEYSALCAAGAFTLGRYGAAAENARPRHAGRGAGRRGRHERADRRRYRTGRSSRRRKPPPQGGVCVVANDNAPGQVVISGTQATVDARRRDRQGQGRQARHAAGRQRAVPLPADAARRRQDARSAGGR